VSCVGSPFGLRRPAISLYLTSNASSFLSRSSVLAAAPDQHLALKNARKIGCVAHVLKLDAEADFVARYKGHLECARLDPMMVKPRSHLGHDITQVGTMPTNFHNVHAILPGFAVTPT
jgi:hypothetical protein